MANNVTLTTNVSIEIYQKIQERMKKTGKPTSHIIREAIEKEFKK